MSLDQTSSSRPYSTSATPRVNPTIVRYAARVRGVPAEQRHDCCVPSCSAQTTPGWLACRDHYLQLPRSVRHTLREVFIRREQHPDLYDEAVAIATRLIITAAGETP